MVVRSLIALAGLLLLATPLCAQELTVRLKVDADNSSRLTVEADYPPGASQFSFLNSYAGTLGLGERFSRLTLSLRKGEQLAAKRIAPGEFRSRTTATHFEFEVNLGAPAKRSDMAHVSWLDHERGFLMLRDLLPGFRPESSGYTRVVIEFRLPDLWNVGSAISRDRDGRYATTDPDNAIFFVGRALRESARRFASMDFSLVTVGQWNFADRDVVDQAERVVKEYTKRTGFQPPGRSVLLLAPFPGDASGWSAETRGSTVMLLFSAGAPARNSLALLGVIFTHELFHLWVPNGLNLVGEYDWFFEGFTLYEALRVALRLGLIDFNEYLKTISNVYNAYLSVPERDQFSVFELSKRRWTNGSALVYNKGMLLAFLYDLALRKMSAGDKSLDDIYRQLFQTRDYQRDANEVILSLLTAPEGMEEFTRSYLSDSTPIRLETLIDRYGLEVQTTGTSPRLIVKGTLDKEQKKLLQSLGYKN